MRMEGRPRLDVELANAHPFPSARGPAPFAATACARRVFSPSLRVHKLEHRARRPLAFRLRS